MTVLGYGAMALRGGATGYGPGNVTDETQVVYVSPLKALGNDIHRNLELPLAGISAALGARGLSAPAAVTLRIHGSC